MDTVNCYLSNKPPIITPPAFFSTTLLCEHFLALLLTVSILNRVHVGVTNGTSKNMGLRKFWQDLEISEVFLTSLKISFLHGLFLLFLSLETFYQRVSGSDF